MKKWLPIECITLKTPFLYKHRWCLVQGSSRGMPWLMQGGDRTRRCRLWWTVNHIYTDFAHYILIIQHPNTNYRALPHTFVLVRTFLRYTLSQAHCLILFKTFPPSPLPLLPALSLSPCPSQYLMSTQSYRRSSPLFRNPSIQCSPNVDTYHWLLLSSVSLSPIMALT